MAIDRCTGNQFVMGMVCKSIYNFVLYWIFFFSLFVYFPQQWKICWTLNCIEAIGVYMCVCEWIRYTIDKSIFHLTCDSHLILSFFLVVLFFLLLSTLCKIYSPKPMNRITFFSALEFFSRVCAFRFFLFLTELNWLEICKGRG